MLGAIFQFLLSLLTQLLSWFGISFGAPLSKQEGQAEKGQERQEPSLEDAPQEPHVQGPEPYSSAEPSQALP